MAKLPSHPDGNNAPCKAYGSVAHDTLSHEVIALRLLTSSTDQHNVSPRTDGPTFSMELDHDINVDRASSKAGGGASSPP